jgi:hypothetical protein
MHMPMPTAHALMQIYFLLLLEIITVFINFLDDSDYKDAQHDPHTFTARIEFQFAETIASSGRRGESSLYFVC